MRYGKYVIPCLGSIVLGWSVCISLAARSIALPGAESSNMKLVGFNDLKGRGAYMVAVKKQGDRYIAYVCAQAGTPKRLNPLTGKVEFSGTSIIDVTDPKEPKYLYHIPGESRPGGVLFSSGSQIRLT